MKLTKIVSNLLDSNTFILDDNGQVIIFDAGVDAMQVANLVGDKKVVAVFLTHGHYDHAFFANSYAKFFGCKIYASKEIKDCLADSNKNYSEGALSLSDFSNFIFLENDGKLKIGNLEIKYFSTPGHSKCGMSFLVESDLFVGDLVFKQGIGRTDLFGGDKKQMLESLQKVQGINFEILHSGHGEDSSQLEQVRNLKTFVRFLSR